MTIFARATRFALLTLILAFSISGLAFADIQTFTASLSGANEVPANGSLAGGTATMIFDTADGGSNVPVHLEFSGLTGAQSGVHIHVAAAGVNGGVRFPLPLGSPMDTSVTLDATDIANLNAELFYINVHSVAFGGGEIRGQFVLSNVVASDPSSWGGIKALYR